MSRRTPFDDAEEDEEFDEAMWETLQQVYDDATQRGMEPYHAASAIHDCGEELKRQYVNQVEEIAEEEDIDIPQ